VLALWGFRSRQRRESLRRRFGPEYERTRQALSGDGRTDRELRARAKRVRDLHLRTLDSVERERFANDWAELQTRFAEDPKRAVRDADELIQALMLTQGYPGEDFEQRVRDLSVNHASYVQHYRAGRELEANNRSGSMNTEELRQALVHYRALFGELLASAGALARREEVHS
jgi:hypothetical protein